MKTGKTGCIPDFYSNACQLSILSVTSCHNIIHLCPRNEIMHDIEAGDVRYVFFSSFLAFAFVSATVFSLQVNGALMLTRNSRKARIS